MAESTKKEYASGGRYNWVWAAVAIVLTAGFFVWLSIASEPSTVAVVEGNDVVEGADVVPAGEFAADPAYFIGERIRLDGITVSSMVGQQAFWTDMLGGVPYLFKLNTHLVESGASVQPGQTLDVVGTVHVMTDSVIAAWERQGAIRTDGQRMEAEFATSFLEVDRIPGMDPDGAQAAPQPDADGPAALN